MSKSEDKIMNVLKDLHIPYQREYSFDSLKGKSGRNLRFDAALFTTKGELLCLLEFQGRQHYFPIDKFGGMQAFDRQQRNDRAKRIYCIKHNIPLIVIPYYDLDKVDGDYIRNAITRVTM